MALLKIHDFDPDYTNTFGGEDIKGQDVYIEGTAEKIGRVDDMRNEHTCICDRESLELQLID